MLDSDGTPVSRDYVDSFRGSYYFVENSPIANYSELDRRLRNGELRLALELPTGFQKDLQRGRQPDVNVFIDAAQPFRAETARGYVESVHDQYQTRLRESKGLPPPSKPIRVEARALYNQAFKSIYAMVPGDIMLLLILIPSMLTALSVVREKELGSIANFYAAPATRLEFLAGKQLPYIGVALVQFATLVALAILLFRVPLKGSWETLVLGGVIYLLASTGFGLLISVFAPTQTAAIFAAAIITILPAVQFSGMFVPVSSLKGGAWFAAKIFPSTYFQAISVGTFTKASDFSSLWRNVAALGGYRAHLFQHIRRVAEKAGELAMRNLRHIFQLGIKELFSLARDPVMLFLIVYSFTFSVYTPAKSAVMDVINASVAIVDEDHSAASRQIRDSLLPPLFLPRRES